MNWKHGSPTEVSDISRRSAGSRPRHDEPAGSGESAVGATLLFATALAASLYSVALGTLTWLGLLH